MPRLRSLLRQSPSFTDRLGPALLQLCGALCFRGLEWCGARDDCRRFDGALGQLLNDAAAAHDLTVACELLFLRFADRSISVDGVDGAIHRRLIEQIDADRYAVIDRYGAGGDSPERACRYTVTLLGAQYLGAQAFDRDGLRLTFGSGGGGQVVVQRVIRRADSFAAAVRADPALSLQCGCRSIEYGPAPLPDPAVVTRLLELTEPLSLASLDDKPTPY